MDSVVLLQMLDYSFIWIYLPFIPLLLYTFYMEAIKRRDPWTKTGEILLILGLIAAILLITTTPLLPTLISRMRVIEVPDRALAKRYMSIKASTFAITVLAILEVIYMRRRVASFSEVLVVTLASLLIAGVTAAILLLDLYTFLLLDPYTHPLLWRLIVVPPVLLTILLNSTVFVINAVRKKELMPKKLILTFPVLPATNAALLLYWDIPFVIVTILIALLTVVATIRAPD